MINNEQFEEFKRILYGTNLTSCYKNTIVVNGWVLDRPIIRQSAKYKSKYASVYIYQILPNSTLKIGQIITNKKELIAKLGQITEICMLHVLGEVRQDAFGQLTIIARDLDTTHTWGDFEIPKDKLFKLI